MKPDKTKISIDDNIRKIEDFIDEVIVQPKQMLRKWSEITRQTPAFKLGYIGQHLASLITGVKGTGSAARGDDLIDGTEVKSCNKLDQLDTCKDCGAKVLRYEEVCPNCNSTNIQRKDDSKWLFSVRNEQELSQYKSLSRIILIISEYPGFKDNNFEDIKISAFEIYPTDPRCNAFNRLIDNHYHNIYLPKIQSKNKANPMNLHPYGIQFYMCNPTLVFQCTIKNINHPSQCQVTTDTYITPDKERTKSLLMPSNLLRQDEWATLNFAKLSKKYSLNVPKNKFNKLNLKEKQNLIPFLDEEDRKQLKLREVVSTTQKSAYQR